MTDQPPPIPSRTIASDPGELRPRLRARAGIVTAIGALLLVLLVGIAVIVPDQEPAPAHYISLSMLLFVTGAVGVLIRRNALVLFMCIELMLNAVNLAFVTFARMHNNVDGHVAVLFVMIVAAAEVVVGLAIIVLIFRRKQSANVDDLSLLRW